jgi:hypothetical protein
MLIFNKIKILINNFINKNINDYNANNKININDNK